MIDQDEADDLRAQDKRDRKHEKNNTKHSDPRDPDYEDEDEYE